MNVEITSLLDQDVYTQKGIFVGRVEDIVLEPENGVVSGLALGDVNRELFDQKGKGIVIPTAGLRLWATSSSSGT